MATGTIIVFPGGFQPDGTSGSEPAAYKGYYSANTPTTGTPKVGAHVLGFKDGTNDTHRHFECPVPEDYSSGGTLYILYKNATVQTGGTAKKVRWKAGVKIVGDTETASFGASGLVYTALDAVSATLASDQAVDTLDLVSIPLTMTGVAARKGILGFFGRDQDHADDDAVGDMDVLLAWIEYTTT